jgi:hypothetical protein
MDRPDVFAAAGIGISAVLIVSFAPQKAQRLWIESEGIEFAELKPCLVTKANDVSKTLREASVALEKPTPGERFAYMAHFIAVHCMDEQKDKVNNILGLEYPEVRQMVEGRVTGDAASLILRADRGE